MNTGEKTPEQMMDDFRRGQVYFKPEEKPKPDFHTMALLAAQTIKNNSVQELLSNAEKIEHWLREPERLSQEFRRKFEDYPRFNEVHKKSPTD